MALLAWNCTSGAISVFADPEWLRSRFHFPFSPPFLGSLISWVSMLVDCITDHYKSSSRPLSSTR